MAVLCTELPQPSPCGFLRVDCCIGHGNASMTLLLSILILHLSDRSYSVCWDVCEVGLKGKFHQNEKKVTKQQIHWNVCFCSLTKKNIAAQVLFLCFYKISTASRHLHWEFSSAVIHHFTEVSVQLSHVMTTHLIHWAAIFLWRLVCWDNIMLLSSSLQDLVM